MTEEPEQDYKSLGFSSQEQFDRHYGLGRFKDKVEFDRYFGLDYFSRKYALTKRMGETGDEFIIRLRKRSKVNAEAFFSELPASLKFQLHQLHEHHFELRSGKCTIELSFHRFHPFEPFNALLIFDPKRTEVGFWEREGLKMNLGMLAVIRGLSFLPESTVNHEEDLFHWWGKMLADSFLDLLSGDFSIESEYSLQEYEIVNQANEIYNEKLEIRKVKLGIHKAKRGIRNAKKDVHKLPPDHPVQVLCDNYVPWIGDQREKLSWSNLWRVFWHGRRIISYD